MRSCKISLAFEQAIFRQATSAIIDVNYVIVISLDAVSNSRLNINFRFFKYVIFLASIDELSSLHKLCKNIDCDIFLVDRTFVAQEIADYDSKIQYSEVFIKIRDINDVILSTNQYIILNFKISDTTINDKSIIASFSRRIYLVNKLKTKILIENDILNTKRIVLNLNKE